MSSDRKRTKITETKKIEPENLDSRFQSAFEEAMETHISDEQEEILSSVPLEEMLERIDQAKNRFGGKVEIRELENGNIILSPPSKRGREHMETEEAPPPGKHSDEENSQPPEHGEMDVAAQKKRRNEEPQDPDFTEDGPEDLVLADPDFKRRAVFVERVREAIRACIPSDSYLNPADMQDVDQHTRYHGLVSTEEPLPMRFKYHRYPAMVSFMLPASHLSPYIIQKGDILYFKRTELALPVLECLYGGGKNSYWGVLCYIPKKWRNIVWQETSKTELPLDQLFRVIALSYVDWPETMRVRGALDPGQVESAYALWQTKSSKFVGDRMPNALKKVITQGLTLSKDATGGGSQGSGRSDNVIEGGNPPNPETGHPAQGNTGGGAIEIKPPRGSESNKPIVDYLKLYQAIVKSEKVITSAIGKDNTALKNTLKAQSKAFETLADNVKALESSTSSKSGPTKSTSAANLDVEAEIRGLKGAVQQMSNAMKSSEAQISRMCEKVDMLLQDKARMTWEEFSQRQRDILSLNQSLAAPMQASMWPHPPSAGRTWMNPHMETGMHTGTSVGMTGLLGTSNVPLTVGTGLSSTRSQNTGYPGPSTGPVGPVQDLSGPSLPRVQEKITITAPTQESESATEATVSTAMSNEEILRLLQRLSRQSGTQK